MKLMMRFLMILIAAVSLTGCTTTRKHVRGGGSDIYGNPLSPRPGQNDMADVRADRMLIWTARLDMQVRNVSNAVNEVVALVGKHKGLIETQSDNGEKAASLTIRIPAKAFRGAITGLEAMGTVTYRNIAGEDVTEEYVDVEARLKNKIVLRDRLQKLLDQAKKVEDILSIETQLNRVQGDIESMEARIRSLKGQVDMATIMLNFRRKPVLGPVGYVLHGLKWGIGKLFVIRE